MAGFGKVGSGAGLDLESAVELRRELRELRKVVLVLLEALVEGRPPALHEDPLRGFLHLPEGVSPEEALRSFRQSRAPVVGRLRCPHCGASLPELEGYPLERCPWCGGELSSEEAAGASANAEPGEPDDSPSPEQA